MLLVHRCLALALGQVHPHAEAVFLAEALAQIEVPTHSAVAGIVQGGAARGAVLGTLGDHIDRPADTAARRRHAIHKGVSPLEHLNPLDRLGGDDLSRQNTVQPVEGNIVAEQLEPAHNEHLGEVAEAE